VTASADLVERMAASGLLDSGGGTTHFAATVLAEYAAGGDYAAQVERFRAAYRAQRDALLEALAESLPDGSRFTRPGGGYFTWVALPPGVPVDALRHRADAHRMAFAPARAFYVDPETAPEAVRLAFSMYPPDQLAEGARRFAAAVRDLAA
jgi:DNA-binding transcriptional MocR family regulator